MNADTPRQPRILVVGAGPAGLSAAYFLKRNGYHSVMVLEKLPRVGGLCCTITEDYKSFDLGANYVTPAYKQTRRLARRVKAKLYVERPGTTLRVPSNPRQPVEFRDFWSAVTDGVSQWRFLLACWKYVRLRFRLNSLINPPGFLGINDHPELCVSFFAWLERHKLEILKPLFEVPITVMGYGYLDEIPAPHALKYMCLSTFIPMCLKCFPPTAALTPWPRRFVLGFQRLWEALSWELNVRTDVKIESITRSDDGVRVRFEHKRQVLNLASPHEDEMTFDYVVLACPFTLNVLDEMKLDLSDEERALFARIDRYSYFLTSYLVPGVKLERPITCTMPLTPIGTPWAITQQMAGSDLIQFYTRVPNTGNPRDPKLSWGVRKAVHRLVRRLHGRIDRNRWHSHDQWQYFEHISAADMRDGFFERLEAMQGLRRTFYVGGIMDFELVENVIAYSRSLVDRHFVRRCRADRRVGAARGRRA